jgi:ABC-type multidrug transport system fused ATPase/permease subunit
VRIGDAELRDIDRKEVSDLIGYVSQDVFLFADTLKNNITLYGDVADSEIENVIKDCGLDDLVKRLPDGLDTIVVENGSNFSGGEKQRINLARGLLRDKKVYLFDEVSSNLDSEATEFIEKKILSLKNKLVISVSHKMPDDIVTGYDEIVALHS